MGAKGLLPRSRRFVFYHSVHEVEEIDAFMAPADQLPDRIKLAERSITKPLHAENQPDA